jgi:hypothetical protein
LSTHLRLGLPSGLLPSGFPINILYAVLFSQFRATCSAHFILLDLIILKWMILRYKNKITYETSGESCSYIKLPGERSWTKQSA